jgi:hypothetical protein
VSTEFPVSNSAKKYFKIPSDIRRFINLFPELLKVADKPIRWTPGKLIMAFKACYDYFETPAMAFE